MGKYDEDKEFCDPVVRCTECQRIIFKEEIQEQGKCPRCGCRKVRNVNNMEDWEMKLLKNKDIDPEFIALFESREVS